MTLFYVRAQKVATTQGWLWVGIAPYPWAVSKNEAKLFSEKEADTKVSELLAAGYENAVKVDSTPTPRRRY